MTAPKGFSSQEKDERLGSEFTTVSPSGFKKNALDVRDKNTVHNVASDAVEALSTTSVLVVTGHVAKKGDLLRFTSGVNDTLEIDVSEVDTNSITLGQTLDTAPSALDTFDILRSTALTVGADGLIVVNSGNIRFDLDSVSTEVLEDTGTPSNSRPLPVKLMGTTGDINITAGDLNVQLSHSSGTPDSVQIGDGTEIVNINASNEMQVTDDTARTSLGVIEGDTTSLDAKTPALGGAVTAASVPVTIASDQTVAVSASSLPLPTGAATEASLATVAGDTTSLDAKLPAQGVATIANSLPVSIASDQTVPVSSASLPLPTGASTSALQTTGNGILTTMNTSLDNIEIDIDVALSTRASESTLSTLNGKVTAVDTGAVTIAASALPTGAATESSLATVAGWDTNAGVVGANTQRVQLTTESLAALENISVTQEAQDIVDLFDTPVLDASSTNINGSAGAFVEVVASLANDVKKIQTIDTTGGYIGLYTGAAASEVLKVVIGPGSDQLIDCSIASGIRISVRRLESTDALTVGNLSVNFIG